MKLYPEIIQGTPEWHELRARNFTASDLGSWALEPVRITKTVDELKDILDRCGIPRKGITKRDDLLTLLEDPDNMAELCDGAQSAILKKIKQGRKLQIMQRDPDSLTMEETLWLARENEIEEQSTKQFGYNIAVKYGKLLEPFARAEYERITGFSVAEMGFCEHDSGGFGCSPDGLVSTYGDGKGLADVISHGLEIKCAIPETHNAWLLAGTLPDEHKLQVHASMAVTGLPRWDFMSFCPGEASMIIHVHPDEFTGQLERGMKTLVSEKAKMKAKLAEIWMMKNAAPSRQEHS